MTHYKSRTITQDISKSEETFQHALLTSTSLRWPAKIRTAAIRSVVHRRAVLSREAVAKYTPRGPHSTSQTGSLCPRYATMFVYVSNDQSRTVESCDAESRYLGGPDGPGSGSKDMAYTGPEWATSFRVVAGVPEASVERRSFLRSLDVCMDEASKSERVSSSGSPFKFHRRIYDSLKPHARIDESSENSADISLFWKNNALDICRTPNHVAHLRLVFTYESLVSCIVNMHTLGRLYLA